MICVMKHYLQPAFLAPPPALEISEAEYFSLKRSMTILNAAFAFEENYDLLVGNYLEIENSALLISASSMVRRRHEYQEMFELKAELNRRAVNFLSSARLFVDQIPQRVRECGSDAKEIVEALSVEYDSWFEYRFMEALRNHVQHSGLAVHSLSVSGKWVPPGRLGRNEFAIEVFSQKKFLALDKNFKKLVLQECPEQVNVLTAVRRYVESLSKVHGVARKILSKAILEARNLCEIAIKRYGESAEITTGLTAFTSSIHDPETAFPVFLDWDDVRIKLSQRNPVLINLSKRVVLSAAS